MESNRPAARLGRPARYNARMNAPHYLFWLAGKSGGGPERTVRSPFDDSAIGHVAQASPDDIHQALDAMVDAFPALRARGAWRRRAACEQVHAGLLARREEFARMIAREAGKPIRAARGEVDRALTTFRLAVEESVRIGGEQLPVDGDERSQGYHCTIERRPVGPCLFITPFNFPLNLVAHKVAPALACGCPFILKPSDRTPVTALLLGELLAAADLPPGSWHILPTPVENIAALAADRRLRLVSFTGSVPVGWKLQALAVGKSVLLELGANSAVIVEPDADIDDATSRIVTGAFSHAGQSCISVQRIFLHRDIAAAATAALIEKTRKLRCGDPLEETTDVGPMIDQAAAIRMEQWLDEACSGGARVLVGGPRSGAFYPPTLLTDVPETSRLLREEAFGPVAVIGVYDDFEQAMEWVNHSRLGIHAGVFTRDLFKARQAFDCLEVGGVIINDVPTLRLDAMPYGGVKESGLGREGVRFAIAHMTELKSLVVRYS